MTHAAHHPDDEAVDRFAAELKAKLADARAKGRGLQDYYEAVASTHYSHAGALKHGRKAKDAPAATEAAP